MSPRPLILCLLAVCLGAFAGCANTATMPPYVVHQQPVRPLSVAHRAAIDSTVNEMDRTREGVTFGPRARTP